MSMEHVIIVFFFFFFQAEDGIRDRSPSRGLGDVYKRQVNVSSKAKVTNIKFSNPSVLEYAGMHNVNQGIDCRPLKAGKCKISCKVKQGGKTYTLSKNITVKKADPFSYVKLNGKNVQ